MNLKELIKRSGSKCEICSSEDHLAQFELETFKDFDTSIYLCEKCFSQASDSTLIEANHWHSLSDSMWSEVSSIQAFSILMLNRLKEHAWAQTLIDQMYLNEEVQSWVDFLLDKENSAPVIDSNGTLLVDGDSVTLIKDLVVKGANFTAKRGTLVKNIKKTDNPLHIEGRVNGTLIVLVASFLKKVN